MKRLLICFILASTLLSSVAIAQNKKSADSKKKEAEADKKDPWKTETFSGLTFRSIGTAKTSGRVVDFAVNPANHNEYFVAAASGGVWKTSNSGITYTPVFEGEGSYSIGCVELDPNNANVVWVGT